MCIYDRGAYIGAFNLNFNFFLSSLVRKGRGEGRCSEMVKGWVGRVSFGNRKRDVKI